MSEVTVAVTLLLSLGRGWVADAVQIGPVAQGATQPEAMENLRDLSAPSQKR
jgi:hypothetical protein